jgi:hypothetical protein
VKFGYAVAFAISVASLSACAAAAPQAEPDRPAITGGWSASPVTEDMQAAAAFAATQIAGEAVTYNLLTNGEVQVVAGINYRFDMVLTNGTAWRVTVYEKLDGTMELTQSQSIPMFQ